CADDAALQERERGFDRIRVNLSSESDVFLFAVVNSLVFYVTHSSFRHSERIGHKLIGHDHVHVTANVLADVLRQCAGLSIFGMEESQIAAALTDTDYNLFGFLASINAPPDLLATYVGLIHFDSAIQFGSGDLLNSVADSVTQIPRSAVVD